MKNLHFIYLGAMLALLLASCNLFNPGGSSADLNGDAESLIAYAQKMYRKSAYDEAVKYYNAALKKDSTKSEAYFGLAKSKMRGMGMDPALVLQIVKTSMQGDKKNVPFVNESKETQNTIYRSMAAVQSSLKPLIRRDSLTSLWEISRDVKQGKRSKSKLHENPKKADSLVLALTKFEDKYGAYPNSKDGSNKFPLSDREYKYSRFASDYFLASTAVTLLKLFDFNGDGYINDKDIVIKIEFDENGVPKIDVNAIMEEAMSNPEVAENLNHKIDELASGAGDIVEILTDIGGQLGLEDSFADEFLSGDNQAEIDSQISAFSDIAMFYKIGDGLDNDGDGCIDEEIFDSVDNDGDGLIDEDLRLMLNPMIFGADGIDNNGDGKIDDPSETYDPFGVYGPKEPRLHPFTEQFVKTAKEYGSTINNGDVETRLAIINDKEGKISLAERRRRVGGCWVFYTEVTFQLYLDAHR